jgi:hypothetical protein
LKTIQQDIYNKAFEFRKNNITKVDTYEEFKKVLKKKEDSSMHIGMELLKKKNRLKTKPKLPSDVFLWMMILKKEFL